MLLLLKGRHENEFSFSDDLFFISTPKVRSNSQLKIPENLTALFMIYSTTNDLKVFPVSLQ